jgi:hypothetical protein
MDYLIGKWIVNPWERLINFKNGSYLNVSPCFDSAQPLINHSTYPIPTKKQPVPQETDPT